MNRKRLVIGVLIILILAVTIVLVWRQEYNQELKPGFQKPIQSELEQNQETSTDIIARNLDTSKWKTYRDDEHGFEFRYPEEMFEIFLGENESVSDRDATKRFLLTLNLFFNINNNTVKTPTLSIFLNEPENDYAAATRADMKCAEILVGAKKGLLCSNKTAFDEALRNYESFSGKGVCSDNSIDSSLVIELASRTIGKKKYTDGISINLQCDHKESLGTIYRSIYESLRFF